MDKIFIVGMPGSGKSTMARYLCSKTKFNYLDLDEEIEKKSQKSVTEIFRDEGQEYFRSLETKLLKEIINKEKIFILSTGGGTPCFNKNMELMKKNGITIFLNTSIDTLIERVSRKNKRPLFNSKNIKETINNMFNERIKYYNQSRFSVKDNDRKEALSIINSNS
tara:strand:+ start:769 stop:1263 length:495 start_codon:yes stop_codon:yes gene_type:complete